MLQVEPIEVLDTNYAYIVNISGRVLLVDPGEAEPILPYIEQLDAILLTHKHLDHVGGVPDILREHNVSVYGGDQESFGIAVKGLSSGKHRMMG